MRPIKFRAWDKVNKRMICLDDNFDLRFNSSWEGNLNWSARDISNRNVIINQRNADLMQFTGLIDKNGMEIYEGDIVNEKDIRSLGVILDQSFCGWTAYHAESQRIFCLGYSSGFEVIGNIYENPELLEKKA